MCSMLFCMIHVCMYVPWYACTCVCMSCMYVRVCACVCVCVRAYVYTWMNECACIYMCARQCMVTVTFKTLHRLNETHGSWTSWVSLYAFFFPDWLPLENQRLPKSRFIHLGGHWTHRKETNKLSIPKSAAARKEFSSLYPYYTDFFRVQQ